MRSLARPWIFVAALVAGLSAACAADDSGAIEFSTLRVEEVSQTRAVVRFDTDVPASCEVEYGLARDQLDATATDPDMEPGTLALMHSVALEDLSPATTYHVRARATDAAGQTVYSSIVQFKTVDGDDITAGLTNVALLSEGTTVVEVSSNWGGGDNDSSYGIHNALDGSESTEWSSDGDGDDAWVLLDLGQPRTISHFAYRSRMMLDGTSIVTRVRVLAEGSELGLYDTPDHRVRYVFELAAPLIDVQEVRVEAVETTGGNTGAREIQFFAP
jgi:hypothetical protein